jgi:hypothetical protein
MTINWISVKDRLPKHDRRVLIYHRHDGEQLGWFDRKAGFWWDWEDPDYQYSSITHWCELNPPASKT